MKFLDRAALVLRYREPFLRGAAGIDENAPAHTVGLRDDVAFYPIPETPTGSRNQPESGAWLYWLDGDVRTSRSRGIM